ncbi:Crp/Fnr family transcriptional regulator [Pedobacter sp.]|jgi:CRP-like cAMP-binding protein|uniref:Crp/Fnr family transcriptional regulator n=1 Tax=Pedobacter sp. TaxID=1411316 RepID=UPI002C62365F|nr:Crp/Fnr family transcriptional regulator [Pedobacter sp.]HWW38172.1 Crp/Fnr family transcriptional regulator [Pedobacter sp.]
MSYDVFFQKIKTYTELSPEAEAAWAALLRENSYNKGDYFVTEGQTPKKVAFIVNGLMYQYYAAENGDMVVKYFFPENRIAGSMTATLTQSPSNFTIKVLEDTQVLEYNFLEFKKLVSIYPDISAFYTRYIEQHWIIEKEPYEVSLRYESAKTNYDKFLRNYPGLVKRLKKQHIAAYLGITPTQLSRIFFANK